MRVANRQNVSGRLTVTVESHWKGLLRCSHGVNHPLSARVCMHISTGLLFHQWREPCYCSPSVYPPWRGSRENRWHCGTGSRASLPIGPVQRCHLAGMASVLIRGSMDATLHLPAVAQPESTDADEVDARSRRLGMPHLPHLLLCFVQQDLLGGNRHLYACGKRIKVEKNSQMVSETVWGMIVLFLFPYLLNMKVE